MTGVRIVIVNGLEVFTFHGEIIDTTPACAEPERSRAECPPRISDFHTLFLSRIFHLRV